MRKDVHYFWDVQMLIPTSMHQVICTEPLSEKKDTPGSEQVDRMFLPFLTWADFGHGWENMYLALWRPESQLFPSTGNAVPFCGSYWNYSYMRPWIFCCRSQVPVPLWQQFLLFWWPLQHSLFTCKVSLLAVGESKKRICLDLPVILKSWQNMWPAPSLLGSGALQADRWLTCLLSCSSPYPHQMGKPDCEPTLWKENQPHKSKCTKTAVLCDSSSSRALLSTRQQSWQRVTWNPNIWRADHCHISGLQNYT